MLFGSYFELQKNIKGKRAERSERVAALPAYLEPLTPKDKSLLSLYASDAISKVQDGSLDPLDLLKAYGKQALNAQRDCNPITEILINDCETSAKDLALKPDEFKSTLPLAGFPISVKDTHNIKGYDSTIGYSANCFKPAVKDGPLVRLLKDAGATIFAKTNVPYTMLSFEAYNDIWGVTENPHKAGYVPGGSSGGESALLAYGGSRLGIGTDVAGSVRVPAHFSGIYSLKCSCGRFPVSGNTTSMPGQEGVPAVASPMTRSMKDLSFFLKTIIKMKPWEYDYTCIPLEWREIQLPKKLKVGVMYSDGVVEPTPACARALDLSVEALKKQGHEIIVFTPPSPLRALRIGSQLLCAEGGIVTLAKQAWGEHNDVGVGRMLTAMRLPRFVKKIYAWVLRYIYGDSVWAYMVEDWNVKTIAERSYLVYERETYKSEFYTAWKDSKIDILLTVPNATPAFPQKGLYESISSCGYTFLFNIVDYAAGVLPVTRVDKETDALPPLALLGKLNRIAAGAYVNYDAEKMHGLPVGVQVVGRRLEEEKVLKAMELVEDALRDIGVEYHQLNE